MLSFGILADAHYAKNKRYRGRYCDLSLGKLAKAVNVFEEHGVDFAVNLGDIVDGERGSSAQTIDRSNYRSVRSVLSRYRNDVFHVLGNHDLESLTKTEALAELRAPEHSDTWYAFYRDNCSFIVLDANFRSDGIAYSRGNYQWTDTMMPPEQLEWLRETIRSAPPGPLFLFIHQNIDDCVGERDGDPHLINNAREIHHILASAKRPVVVLQGHDHRGWFKCTDGVEYVGLQPMCEGDDVEQSSFAIVEINDDASIRLRGFGPQPSYALTGPLLNSE